MSIDRSSKLSSVQSVKVSRYTPQTPINFAVDPLNTIKPFTLGETMDSQHELYKNSGVQAIIQKLRYGSKLSNTELEELRETDPDMYKKAVKAEQEREDFERVLNSCKSQEAVDNACNSMRERLENEEKHIKQAYLSEKEKEDKLELLSLRKAAIENVITKFRNSNRFKSLPASESMAIKQSKEASYSSKQTPHSFDLKV